MIDRWGRERHGRGVRTRARLPHEPLGRAGCGPEGPRLRGERGADLSTKSVKHSEVDEQSQHQSSSGDRQAQPEISATDQRRGLRRGHQRANDQGEPDEAAELEEHCQQDPFFCERTDTAVEQGSGGGSVCPAERGRPRDSCRADDARGQKPPQRRGRGDLRLPRDRAQWGRSGERQQQQPTVQTRGSPPVPGQPHQHQCAPPAPHSPACGPRVRNAADFVDRQRWHNPRDDGLCGGNLGYRSPDGRRLTGGGWGHDRNGTGRRPGVRLLPGGQFTGRTGEDRVARPEQQHARQARHQPAIAKGTGGVQQCRQVSAEGSGMAGIGRRVFLSSDPPAETQPEQALQAGRRTTPLPDQGIEQLGLDAARPVSIGQVLRDCQSRGDGGQDLCRAEPGSPGPVCPSLPPGDGEPGSRTGQSLQGEPLPRARHPGEEADQHSQPSHPGHTDRAQPVQLSAR